MIFLLCRYNRFSYKAWCVLFMYMSSHVLLISSTLIVCEASMKIGVGWGIFAFFGEKRRKWAKIGENRRFSGSPGGAQNGVPGVPGGSPDRPGGHFHGHFSWFLPLMPREDPMFWEKKGVNQPLIRRQPGVRGGPRGPRKRGPPGGARKPRFCPIFGHFRRFSPISGILGKNEGFCPKPGKSVIFPFSKREPFWKNWVFLKKTRLFWIFIKSWKSSFQKIVHFFENCFI